MWISFFILPFLILCDSRFDLSVLGLAWPTQLSFVFLIYVFLKRPVREAIWLMLFFAVLSHALGQMSLSEILMPYLLVLFLVGYYKKRILIETYIVEAIWVMALFFVFLSTQSLYYDVETFFALRFYQSLTLALFVLVHGILAFAAFIFLDWLYAL